MGDGRRRLRDDSIRDRLPGRKNELTSQISSLEPGTTYLAEATYPENRIVIHYAEPALFMLGALESDGLEMTYEELIDARISVR